MANIEVVIKIPEEDYLIFSELSKKEKVNELSYYEKIIAKGIPLPKGHGNLIDINDIKVMELEDSLHFIRHEKGDEIDFYIDAPTIIEADKAEKVRDE